MANSSPSLMSLPEEVILFIFVYCDTQSLGRLARTCKKFRNLIYTEDSCWCEKSTTVLGSNMVSPDMQRKSTPNLASRKKCEISKMWVEGTAYRRIVVTYERCMPWISLHKHFLFTSLEGRLIRFARKVNGNIRYDNRISVPPLTDDISKFIINNDEVVSASRDGKIYRWCVTTLNHVNSLRAHSSDIYCIDAKQNIIVTGSRDKNVKIWTTFRRRTFERSIINLNVRVLSIAIMPSLENFVVGLPGTRMIHPLQFFNLNRATQVLNFGTAFRDGAGILDIYPETEHTFLSCGYDTTVKLWDVRTPNNFVASWMDPYDNGIYCVKSDHAFTIVSGASRNRVVHIWDKRHTQCRQLHHVPGRNSPTYSVEFDASHMYGAFDRSIVEFSYLCK